MLCIHVKPEALREIINKKWSFSNKQKGIIHDHFLVFLCKMWELSGRVLDSRPKGRRFEPHWCHCIVSLSKTHSCLELVQPRKTCPNITERLLTDERIKQN